MAVYTIEINELMKNNFDFGLLNYPIFDESYRQQLNAKILSHYRFREIGVETPALFKHYLNLKMNEIMPLYNQWYKSAMLDYEPLYNMDYTQIKNKTDTENKSLVNTGNTDIDDTIDNSKTDTINSTITDVGKVSKTGTDRVDKSNTDTLTNNLNENLVETHGNTHGTVGTKWKKELDTPQGSITTLDNDTYMSTAEKNTDNTTVTDNGNGEKTKTNTGTAKTETSGADVNTYDSDVDSNNTNTTNQTNTSSEDNTRNTKIGKEENITEENAFNSNTNSSFKGIMNVDKNTLLQKYRQTFVNIDMMIISELKELFMNIY